MDNGVFRDVARHRFHGTLKHLDAGPLVTLGFPFDRNRIDASWRGEAVPGTIPPATAALVALIASLSASSAAIPEADYGKVTTLDYVAR